MIQTASPITLRPYQEKAVKNVARAFLRRLQRRQLGVLPTGCGKTRVFAQVHQDAEFDAWIQTFPATHRKILVLAHRDELIQQAAEKLREVNPHLRVEIEQADQWATPDADVVVASIATIGGRSGKRLMRFDPEQFRIVIIDEAHHAIASSYIKTLQYFNILPPDDFHLNSRPAATDVKAVLKWQRTRLATWDQAIVDDSPTKIPPTLLLGVTATPKRGDDVGLEAVFSEVVFHEPLLKMIEEGYLCRLRGRKVETDTDLDVVHTRAGDFAADELDEAVNTAKRNAKIIRAYQEYAEGRKAVVFCTSVDHSMRLAEAFNATGVPAACVHGGMSKPERKQILKAFHLGELLVLTNCDVLTEGWDEPTVDCIIHAAPTKSGLRYSQRTGRGTRLWNESVAGFFGRLKEDCLILDLVDLTTRHSLITAADLFGLPAKFDFAGEDMVKVAKKVEQTKTENPQINFDECQTLEDIQLRARDVDLFVPSPSAEIMEMSDLAWVQGSEDNFHVQYPVDGGFSEAIDLRQNLLGQWEVKLTRGWKSPEEIMEPQPDKESAFAAAERWIAVNRPKQFNIVQQNAKWRQQPPTNAQIAKLRRLGLEKLDWRKLNMGQVSDILNYQDAKIAARRRAVQERLLKRTA
jgi:superfamily II DNA or RNA helicase